MTKYYNSINEETQEIIGKIPSRTVRYGNIVIFGIFILLLVIGYIIPCRDTVQANAKIYLLSNNTSIAKALVPSYGYGNIHIGQKVLISLDCYPSSQYGYLTGYIKNKDSVMTGGSYIVIIKIYNNKTNYNKEIKSLKEMSGKIDIVVREYRLINKIIGIPFG